MRKAESSTNLNSFQQAGHILLKQNALKIGGVRNRNDRLGLSGPPILRTCRFNNLENLVCLNVVELWGTHIYNFDYNSSAGNSWTCGSHWKESKDSFGGGGSAPDVATGVH
jgi:hypothetical protein